ncbi:MAG: hypothetical protein ACTTGJ_03535 [Clostridium sp.]
MTNKILKYSTQNKSGITMTILIVTVIILFILTTGIITISRDMLSKPTNLKMYSTLLSIKNITETFDNQKRNTEEVKTISIINSKLRKKVDDQKVKKMIDDLDANMINDEKMLLNHFCGGAFKRLKEMNDYSKIAVITKDNIKDIGLSQKLLPRTISIIIQERNGKYIYYLTNPMIVDSYKEDLKSYKKIKVYTFNFLEFLNSGGKLRI